MGIISDTYEDIQARNADNENLAFFLRAEQPARDPRPSLYTCPVCYQLLEEHEVNRHLLHRHASEHVYLRVDGRVIRDGAAAWSTGSLHECDLVVLGFDEAEASVQLNGEPVQNVRVRSSQSLLPFIPADFVGHVALSVRIERQTRTFNIYCGRQSRFHPRPIDRAVIELQRALDRGTEPNWEDYRRRWTSNGRVSELERRYARGHYTYSLGMWLESRHDTAGSRKHLEEAFSLLSSFDTPLARSALGILAIRMNAFDYLRQWKPFARLHLACAFFVDRDLALRPVPVSSFQSAVDVEIYADTFVETYLDALAAFYAADADTLERCILTLTRHEMCDEPNNKSKCDLLQARTLTRAGRLEEAREFYERLISDPMFGDEAQEHLT